MTVMRVCALLASTLAVLLCVVIIREVTTQVHYELSQMDAREHALRQQIWERELELARLRNPMLIRARLMEVRAAAPDGRAPATERPKKP